MYLQPTKVPAGVERLSLKSALDTTYIQFNGENYQPTFYKNKKDTLELDFTVKSLFFKSSSGNQLNGWLIQPKNKTPHTTIIHFHGNAGFLLSQYRAITPLLNQGYQIFIFDYSGFGLSEGKATRDNVLKDGLSAVDYVLQMKELEKTKLIIYGQSLGGHLSAVVASKRENKIDGLVIEGAFSSHKKIAAETAGIFGRILVSEKYSALKSIKDFNKPVLIIHSTEDKTIPFKMGQELYGSANNPKSFYEIKKCHMCGPENYPVEISKKIKAMLTMGKSKND